MRRAAAPLTAALTALALVAALAALAACGGSEQQGLRPKVGVKGEERQAARDLGFPAIATKNTTRVAGADPVADAAAVARAVFPGPEATARPRAVALVDGSDWRAALPAAVLAADPVRAPLLLSAGGDLPGATAEALGALAPSGSPQAAGAQVVRVGTTPAPGRGLKDTVVPGAPGPELAAALDRFVETANGGKTSDAVVVVGTSDARYAMPAAAWAAKSGDPILFSDRDAVPAATRRALERHQQPRIYVLGPTSVVSDRAVRELRRLGTVKRIAGADPVSTSVAFARYVDGDFGWGARDPGHGLLFVDARRPTDAAAAAALSSTGTFPPLLVHDGGAQLARPLEAYLLDVQPGYRRDPVRGVYNHGWIVGDESTMSTAVQSRVDALLQIVPEDTRG